MCFPRLGELGYSAVASRLTGNFVEVGLGGSFAMQTEYGLDPKPEDTPQGRLPSTFSYCQIAALADKLGRIGCSFGEDAPEGSELIFFTPEEVELLAEYEHTLWVDECSANGWTFGAVKDAQKKQSPFLAPYEQLPEEIKEHDRETVHALLPFIKSIGLKAYRIG
jgi:hypothetical protein